MVALVEHQQRESDCGHTSVVVISNRPEATGLGKADALGVATLCLDHRDHTGPSSRAMHEATLLDALASHRVELVVLSGYMRLLSPAFLKAWGGLVVNIHPSLLPAFPGAHAHRDVLSAGVSVTGCTVHVVDEGMDTGRILDQVPVPVFPDDDEATLSHRVKLEEHRLYPTVLDRLVSGE
jgi:phosphoribosylglycinamide formyltransferase-1